MPDDLTPTPEDYAVDPRAMLEMAEKATKGPWEVWQNHALVFSGPARINVPHHLSSFRVQICEPDCIDYEEAREAGAEGVSDPETDAKFIAAAARTALPALARRLIAADHRVRDLELLSQTYFTEDQEIEIKNGASQVTAEILLKIARTGEHRGRFGGDTMEAAAQAILGLHAEVVRLKAELAGRGKGKEGP